MSQSHRNYEPFELAENMEEDLGMFEAAVRPSIDLNFSQIEKIAFVVDGGSRESAVRSFANLIASHLAATASERQSNEFTGTGQPDLEGTGLLITPVPLEHESAETELKSLGEAADSLLQSLPSPILCIRQAMTDEAVENALDTVLVAISSNDKSAIDTVSWAMRLVRRRVIVVEWNDGHAREEARKLMHGREEDPSVAQAVVGRALTSELGALVGAAQRHGLDGGVDVHVEYRSGSPVKEILELAKSFHCGLLLVGRPQEHTSAGYHLVGDLLLATTRPVLVV